MTEIGIEGEFVVDEGGDLLEQATAVFDPARRYRYLLTRTWSGACAWPGAKAGAGW